MSKLPIGLVRNTRQCEGINKLSIIPTVVVRFVGLKTLIYIRKSCKCWRGYYNTKMPLVEVIYHGRGSISSRIDIAKKIQAVQTAEASSNEGANCSIDFTQSQNDCINEWCQNMALI